MEELERVFAAILWPSSRARRDLPPEARREAAAAVVAVRRVFRWPTKLQLKAAAKKLDAARQSLERLGPPFVSGINAPHVRWLDDTADLLEHEVAEFEQSRGRDREVGYRQKLKAGSEAFLLLLRWRPKEPPTPGEHAALTAALFEAATGKEVGDVETACQNVVKNATEDGYRPDEPERFLEMIRASRAYLLELLQPDDRRRIEAERADKIDRLLATKR